MQKTNLSHIILLLIYAFFCVLMFQITLQYFPIDFDVAFLRIKQQYIHFTHYKIAFYIHVTFSVFSLFAGFTQFSRKIRMQYTKVHKTVGWMYLVSVVLLAAPSGLIIGYYANGGFWSQFAFCLLAIGWFWFTLKAFLNIKQGDCHKHQIFMIRSFALTLSAFTISCKKEVQKEKSEATPIIEKENATKELESSSSQHKKDTLAITDAPTTSATKEENPVVSFEKRVFKEESDHKGLLGYYVGRFGAVNEETVSEKNGSYFNRINISIDHIKNDSLFGHSVVAGNARLFKGRFESKTLFAEVFEPGDDQYDGVFEFTIDTEKKKIDGIWIANDANLAVPKREYKLNKRKFEYTAKSNLLIYEGEYDYNFGLTNSQEYEGGEMEAIHPKRIVKLNASTQELTNTDIENLNKGELEVLRNLIYARHGYSFKNRKMRYFFDGYVDWYIPVSTDVRKSLTKLEKKNIDLIKRYEQHAERYYDYFGR